MATKKRVKKYNPLKSQLLKQKYEDKIPEYERRNSTLIQYANEFRAALETNTITQRDMAEHVISAHRFTFMLDLNYINVRETIEKILYTFYHVAHNDYKSDAIYKLTQTQRKLLLAFVDEIKNKLYSITSREVYALLFSEMIKQHLSHCENKIYLNWLLDMENIKAAACTCLNRIYSTRIERAKTKGLTAITKDGFNIEFVKR